MNEKTAPYCGERGVSSPYVSQGRDVPAPELCPARVSIDDTVYKPRWKTHFADVGSANDDDILQCTCHFGIFGENENRMSLFFAGDSFVIRMATRSDKPRGFGKDFSRPVSIGLVLYLPHWDLVI